MHLRIPCLNQQGLHGSGLVKTMLQLQPTAGQQMRRGLRGNGADVDQTVCTADQGCLGFGLQGRQMRVCVCDVRRVGDDEIKAALHAAEPIALQKLHCQTESLGIGLRHYLALEQGNEEMALGRYNGSRGQLAYPQAVLAAQRRWQP